MHVAEHQSVEELRESVRAEREGRARDRVRAVALAREGRTTPEIVAALGVPRRSVQRWVARYNADGLAGLRQHAGGGAPPRLRAADHDRLRARLDAGPTDADGCCAWGGRAVARVLGAEFGVALSLNGVYALLHRLDYSWLRPRPRHPKSDPAAQAAFKKSSPTTCGPSPTRTRASGCRSGTRTRPGSASRGR
jgi:transposase